MQSPQAVQRSRKLRFDTTPGGITGTVVVFDVDFVIDSALATIGEAAVINPMVRNVRRSIT